MPSGREQVFHEQVTITVGGLAQNVAIGSVGNLDGTREQGFRIKKMKYAVSFEGKTAGEGPVTFGVAHTLNAAEVAEALIADPQHNEDIPATERGNRKVYPLEFFPSNGVDRTQSHGPMVFRNIRFPWKEVSEGQNIFWWVFAQGSALSTGMVVEVAAVYFGEWLRD